MDIVERLRQEIAGYTDGPIEAAEATMHEAADVIEKLRETNIMQARWLYEAQRENQLFKDKVRQWLDIGKPAATESE